MQTEGYWVYEITTPDGMKYIGRSGRKYTCQRWQPSLYKKTALEPYIDEFGWNALEKIFVDGLSKEQSFQLEDELIKIYKEKGCCINNICSGGLQCDGERKEYQKQYYETHKEEYKQRYETHKEEKKQYNKQYNKVHKEEILEYHKQYRETHKEQMREYKRKWRVRQKELKKRAELNYDTLW